MKTVYVDSNYHCHVDNADGRTQIQTSVFDSMCNTEIECYLLRPIEDEQIFVQCFDEKSAYKAWETYHLILDEINASYSEGVNSI